MSLAEVLIALVLATVAFGLAVALETQAVKLFARTEERFDPREQAYFLLADLRAGLADAVRYTIAPGGRRLEFGTARSAGVLALGADGRLTYQAPGRSAEVFPAAVRDLRVGEAQPGLVQVVLTVERPSGALTIEDHVLVPAVRPAPGVPWQFPKKL